MSDPFGLTLIDRIGADKVMWSSDYPHMEGTFGATWRAKEQVLKAVPADQARMILGETAIKLFGL